MSKSAIPPQKPCRCTSFCLEDIERTGRYCKIEVARKERGSDSRPQGERSET
jgi:hypothetical protein